MTETLLNTEAPTEEATQEETTTEETTETTTEESSEVEKVFGKYNDMEAAEKAFKHLESENGRLRREKTPEAPEEYVFDFSEEEDVSDVIKNHNFAEDDMLKELAPTMKELGLTQAQAEGLVKAKLNYDMQFYVDPAEEIAKLGPDGGDLIAEVSSFVGKNFDQSEQAVLNDIATSADGVKFIKTHLMSKKSIPGSDVNTVTESSEDVLAKALELRTTTKDFQYNTNAIERYDKLMDKAALLQTQGL